MSVKQRALRNAGFVGAAWAVLQFIYSVAMSGFVLGILATAVAFVIVTVVAFLFFLPTVWLWRKARSSPEASVMGDTPR